MNGILFLVVGPSGAGKDTLMLGARAHLANDERFVFARRSITRPADAGGEDHEAIDVTEFNRRRDAGGFLAHWQAHELNYGLPVALENELAAGKNVLANVSRAAIPEIIRRYQPTKVVEVIAPREILTARLRARGRELEGDLKRRLARKIAPYPPEADVLTIKNDSTPEIGTERLLGALMRSLQNTLRIRQLPIDTWHENVCFLHRDCPHYVASDYLGTTKVDISGTQRSIRSKVNVIDDAALLGIHEIGLSRHAFETLGLPEHTKVTIERTPSPKSGNALRSKLNGNELSQDEMHMVIRDIAEDRYTEKEIAAFLVAASQNLTVGEVQSLTHARAGFAHCFDWGNDLVVDKHSMGGIPGSRITMIVVPIVAAHGLLIPKTSSRAITSAAGTADAMETVAKVELTPDDVQRTVSKSNGCIAWNGRLNHSIVDDVMNSITRPLGVDSTKWAVASILSKKLAAGATHTIIDIPVGPYAKVQQAKEGRELSRLFEEVGAGIGMTVIARVTDGSHPIGRGIGPALEVRDVYKVLQNASDAPKDLREKALGFAASILEWDPNIPRGQGRKTANSILQSGQALSSLERIIDAQGRKEIPDSPGNLVYEVKAPHSGNISNIDSYRVSGIARRAGAPMDKSSGIDLSIKLGQEVKAGDNLYFIHSNVESELHIASVSADRYSGIKID